MTATSLVPLVDDASLDAALAAGGLVAVEFSAAWCAPCRVMAPVVEEAARALAPALRVVQVDADASPRAMTRFGIRGLPTILVFRDGALVERIVGAQPRAALLDRLGRLAGA